jgi:ACS family hexuronate transporter-like MFS transporter
MFPKRTVAAVVGIGTSAGSIGGMLIAAAAGWILQLTHSYVPLFIVASCAYLVALFFIVALAPGLKKAEFAA